MLIKLCLNSEQDALPEWTLLEFQGEVIGDGGLAGNDLGQIILKDVSDNAIMIFISRFQNKRIIFCTVAVETMMMMMMMMMMIPAMNV